MPSTGGSASKNSRFPLADAIIALPAMVAASAWMAQCIARFEPTTKGAALTALGLVVGSVLSAVTATIGIVRLLRFPTSRSIAGYAATFFALAVGALGVEIAVALIGAR